MGVMSTNNGQHRTGKGIMVGDNWKETIETHFVNDQSELRQDASDQLQVPIGSILYQPVTVNIHYPKLCVWTEDVIADLKSYSAAEDKQGIGMRIITWEISRCFLLLGGHCCVMFITRLETDHKQETTY
jgi:hypothetical protein